MPCMIQVVITPEKGQTETREIAVLEREDLTPTTLGLTRADGKALRKALQAVVVEQQMTAYLKTQRPGTRCGHLQRRQGSPPTQVRTVVGPLSVQSPRLDQCPCQPHPTETYRPLAALLPEPLTPEWRFLETTWAALGSYSVTAQL